MHVLVTGAAGYIGAHVVRDLLDRGDAVIAVDDLSTGEVERIPGATFVRMDISDPSSRPRLAELLDGVDTIMHLAALKRVDESLERPHDYQRVNVGGVANVLAAATAAGTPRIVLSSTAAVYGDVDGVVDEESSTVPVSPYGTTKLAGERLLAEAARSGIAAASLRYFNVAGAASAELRERAAMNLIPQVLRRIESGVRPQIFGTDYPTPDGTCVRDYVHVQDVSSAHLAVMDALVTPGHRVYNLGTGRGASVLEVVRALLRARGSDLEPEYAPRRAGDPATVVADPSRIAAEIGWRASRGLDDIVASAVA